MPEECQVCHQQAVRAYRKTFHVKGHDYTYLVWRHKVADRRLRKKYTYHYLKAEPESR
jgi:hypothetical protein